MKSGYRPSERTAEDLDVIYNQLKELKVLEKFHPLLLQQLCYYGYYECLEKGVTLFRQGDMGTNWYTVLTGSLAVLISDTSRPKVHQDGVMLCMVGPGTSFGEGILTGKPHSVTVVTKDSTELIRVELKDFKLLWERNKQLMESAITPLSALPGLSEDMKKLNCGPHSEVEGALPNPAAPITTVEVGNCVAKHPAHSQGLFLPQGLTVQSRGQRDILSRIFVDTKFVIKLFYQFILGVTVTSHSEDRRKAVTRHCQRTGGRQSHVTVRGQEEGSHTSLLEDRRKAVTRHSEDRRKAVTRHCQRTGGRQSHVTQRTGGRQSHVTVREQEEGSHTSLSENRRKAVTRHCQRTGGRQ
ncbi:hypothetical protein ACOMHN_028804 [Nucella lapillus]